MIYAEKYWTSCSGMPGLAMRGPRPQSPIARFAVCNELTSLGPTSANSCPARFVWVRSDEAKARLAALVMPANQPKILAAPLTVIIGYDLAFAANLPKLFPARGAQLRLDCGPMSGFDHDKVDKQFFPNTRTCSNFLCCLGYGSDKDLFPRNPRLLSVKLGSSSELSFVPN
jgi:3-hydroxypropanoate dehydrogenase